MTVVDGEKLENFYPSREGTNFKLKNLYHSPCCQNFPLYIKLGSALNSSDPFPTHWSALSLSPSLCQLSRGNYIK